MNLENIKQGEKLQSFIDNMNQESSQENLFKALKQGLEFRELANNQWQKVTTWSDDYSKYHYILLYQQYTFKPYAIGRYKKTK